MVDRHSGIYQGTGRCRCSHPTDTTTDDTVQIERSGCTETSADAGHLYLITYRRYGYRRIKAMLRTCVSEKVIRRIMAEDGLTAHVPRRRRYSSYEGETTPAPDNLVNRGCHYRWPGWLDLMERYGLTRSMSAKGCSSDNAAAEGFFGRMKTESVCPEHWEEYTRDEVLVLIDDYIRWYNHERIKQSLGWMSPVQYRQSQGMAA